MFRISNETDDIYVQENIYTHTFTFILKTKVIYNQ